MSGKETLTFALGETLDVSACDAVHGRLLEGLRTSDRIVLDAGAAASVDVTFLQILVAAQRSAQLQGKSIAFARPPEGPLADALVRCGFAPPATATSLTEILVP